MQNGTRVLTRAHRLLVSYRWLSLALAGITLFSDPSSTPLLHAIGLFLLATGLNLLLLSRSTYLWSRERFPLVLALDILAGLVLVWSTGGRWLPFFPYALSSLIAPIALAGWRSIPLVAPGFVILDALGFLLVGIEPAHWPGLLLARPIAPILFMLIWSFLFWLFLPEPSGTPPRRWQPQWTRSNADSPPEPQGRVAEQPGPAPEAQSTLPGRERCRVVPIIATRTVAAREGQDLRRVLYELTPATDTDLSLALKQLLKDFSYRSGITTHMAHKGDQHPIKPVQHMTLYQLAQEALLNIQQHAQARSARLTLGLESHTITLTIQDDGIGLPNGTYQRSGMHALRGLAHRLAEIDGYLEVFNSEQGGLIVRGVVPR